MQGVRLGTEPELTPKQISEFQTSAAVGAMLVPALVNQYGKHQDMSLDDKSAINQIKDAALHILLNPAAEESTRAQFMAASIVAAYEYGKRGAILPETLERLMADKSVESEEEE